MFLEPHQPRGGRVCVPGLREGGKSLCQEPEWFAHRFRESWLEIQPCHHPLSMPLIQVGSPREGEDPGKRPLEKAPEPSELREILFVQLEGRSFF